MEIIKEMRQRAKDGHLLYKCICTICGNSYIKKYSTIKEKLKPCGHIGISGTAKRYAGEPWKSKKLKGVFHGMMERCYNPKDKSYRFYGGKGHSSTVGTMAGKRA